MADFATMLKRFDRKERNWLLRDVLGNPIISPGYRERLEQALHPSAPDLRIPDTAFWAIDFHWNWLVGALTEMEGPGRQHPLGRGDVAPNQQDVDLLVAFENTAILVEAKATGSWDNKQTGRKLKRLAHLRNAAARLGDKFAISLHFVLTSPAKPAGFDSEHVWHTHDGNFIWMPLHTPPVDDLLSVIFPKSESFDGPIWKVEQARSANRTATSRAGIAKPQDSSHEVRPEALAGDREIHEKANGAPKNHK